MVGAARRRGWLDSSVSKILPGVNYFQGVFTLPQQFARLALGNRGKVFSLLMQSAWAALSDVLKEDGRFEPAALIVLHTWNQRLEFHPHVHALIPGGGPTPDGRRWITTRHKKHRRRKNPYLTDNIELGKRFREKFVSGLRSLHANGELKLEGEWARLQDASTFEKYTNSIAPDGWNVFIESPPVEDSAPENVLKYLARYMSGGPISDRRLISNDETTGIVKFLARSNIAPPAGEKPKQVIESLPGVEFTRRWSLHILPRSFIKSRNYGGFSNTHSAKYLSRCRRLLGINKPSTMEIETPKLQAESIQAESIEGESILEETNLDFAEHQRKARPCSRCNKPMRCISASERPSWRTTMNGQHRPPWYQRW